MRIAFVIERFSVRGVEGVVWSYAHYNEKLLNNDSIIIVRAQPGQPANNDITDEAKDMFMDRFPVFVIDENKIDPLLIELKVDVCVVPCYGTAGCYMPTAVPTIAHCVFVSDAKLGTMRASISNWVSRGHTRVLPNMIDIPDTDGTNMREELGIPADAFVFGRYGGWEQFSVPWAVPVVVDLATERPDVYFVLMHTKPFEAPPNVLFVRGTCSKYRKRQFIDTCDAMIHAREDGETFGCAVGEFAVCGKPIVTCLSGDMAHAQILGDKAVVCAGPDQLKAAMGDTARLRALDMSGNGYEQYMPARVTGLLRRAALEVLCMRHGAAGLPFVY